eukprot:1568605-Pyramimonas_sp.AAC.1
MPPGALRGFLGAAVDAPTPRGAPRPSPGEGLGGSSRPPTPAGLLGLQAARRPGCTGAAGGDQ